MSSYYGVHTGHNPGIYLTLEACQKAIDGFHEPVFKSFKHILDAEQFVRHGEQERAPLHLPLPLPLNLPLPLTSNPYFTLPVKSTNTLAPAPVKEPETPPSTQILSLLSKYKSHAPSQSTLIHIYTDGGTIGNGRHDATGGYGVFIPETIHTKEKLITRKLVPGNGKITNNIAELKAIIHALKEILALDVKSSQFIIHYDSTYAADVITGKKKGHANIELVKQGQTLLSDCHQKQLNVAFEHVYSHTGKQDLHSIGNEIADKLAGMI